MLAVLRRVDDAVARLEDVFLGLSMGTIAALLLLAVVLRYVVGDPLTWGEEFIVALFGWTLFIGTAAAFRTHLHIRVDVFVKLMPPALRRLAAAIAAAAGMVILAALAWYGAAYTDAMWDSTTPMLGVSMAWVVGALPVGMGLALLHVVRLLLDEGAVEAFRAATEVEAEAGR